MSTVDRAARAWWTRYRGLVPDAPVYDDLDEIARDEIRSHVEPAVTAALNATGPGESIVDGLLHEIADLQRQLTKARSHR